MQLLTPDIVAELRGLSISVSAGGCALGLVLWVTGWWGHRFWIVLFTTLLAGILGMISAPGSRLQPVLVGLLSAVAAGLLALSLVRVVAFGAGGFAAWLALHTFAPASWNEPFLCFLAGGLVGLFLFRVWTMVLTSFLATQLMGYFGLCLADSLGKLDGLALSEQRGTALSWACGLATLGGFIVQFLLERWRMRRDRWRHERYPYSARRARAQEQPWWGQWGMGNRRAG
jgi:hypothetical protein